MIDMEKNVHSENIANVACIPTAGETTSLPVPDGNPSDGPEHTPTIDEKPQTPQKDDGTELNGNSKEETKYAIDKTIPVYKPQHETVEP